MKKIETLSQYKELLRQNKIRLHRTDTNCLLMAGAMEEYILCGCLYVEEYPQGLIVFLDEGAYYNLYYFWESGLPLPEMKQDKPVLIEELNNNGSRDAYLARFEPILEQAGFTLLQHNLQLATNPKDCEEALRARYQEKKARLEAQGFRLAFCQDAVCLERVLALWESALEATDFPQSHKALDPSIRILCVLDSEDTLCAVNWWRSKGKTSEGRHLVTDKRFERRGIASTLQYAWLVDGLDNGVERFITWIAETNEASLGLHQKAGFLCNGRESRQYILK